MSISSAAAADAAPAAAPAAADAANAAAARAEAGGRRLLPFLGFPSLDALERDHLSNDSRNAIPVITDSIPVNYGFKSGDYGFKNQ